ncbi:hypothetical protein TNCV_965861 [Trichonephila clavipes]|nr:hypothetical protein TNCV_965861 [Trichonephila clavipes]
MVLHRFYTCLPKSSKVRGLGSNTSTYGNLELCNFQISSARRSAPITETQVESVPEPNEIDKVIEEVVDPTRQINLEMDGDDVQQLMGFHNQELTIDALLEMHKQEQDIEELNTRFN